MHKIVLKWETALFKIKIKLFFINKHKVILSFFMFGFWSAWFSPLALSLIMKPSFVYVIFNTTSIHLHHFYDMETWHSCLVNCSTFTSPTATLHIINQANAVLSIIFGKVKNSMHFTYALVNFLDFHSLFISLSNLIKGQML